MSARGLNILLVLLALLLGGAVVHLRLRVRNLQSQIDTLAGGDVGASTALGTSQSPREVPMRPFPVETRDPVVAAAQTEFWKSVQAGDLALYAHNLRLSGCPEPTVRDLVMGEINRQFAARRAQLTIPVIPSFWQSAPQLSESERQAREEELRALDQEKKELIRSLLALDPAIEQRKSRDGVSYTDNRLGWLSGEKQDQVSLVREQYNDQWSHVQEAAKNDPASSPEAVSLSLQRLDEDRLAKLAQILSPAELIEHELQTSWTSIQLRQRLAGIQPSEAEFRAIYDLQKPFDDEFVHRFNNRTDEAALLRKQAAQLQLDANLRAMLGDQRYAEFLLAQRPRP